MASGPVGYCIGGSDHVTFNARAARMGRPLGLRHDPTKFPFCTTCTTPGTSLIDGLID